MRFEIHSKYADFHSQAFHLLGKTVKSEYLSIGQYNFYSIMDSCALCCCLLQESEMLVQYFVFYRGRIDKPDRLNTKKAYIRY